jgi:hypothetical protein
MLRVGVVGNQDFWPREIIGDNGGLPGTTTMQVFRMILELAGH